MIRHVTAIAIALLLSPAWLCAQNTLELTVNTQSAKVYKGPSTGSPVIGTAPRGTVLEVTRELGDWVKVNWPSVPDSTGYVHASAGSIDRHITRTTNGSNGFASRPAVRPEAAPSNVLFGRLDTRSESSAAVFVTPRTHVMGFGGRMGGSTFGYGGTARGWSEKRLGLQVEVSRYSLSSAETLGQVTSVEFAPSVLYSLPDRVADYVWLRPYVGGGLNLHRATQTGFGSTNKVGFQAFGGTEATFSSFPRFAVSADLGYRSTKAPYDGFDLGGLRLSVSGHWYVK